MGCPPTVMDDGAVADDEHINSKTNAFTSLFIVTDCDVPV